VLGVGVERSPLSSHYADVPAAHHIPPLRDNVSAQEARLAARGVARRKLQRKENGEMDRLSSMIISAC
jgi:hypothetical protein